MSRVCLSLTALLVAALPSSAQTPSFVNDIVPIFTRFGCNSGACHGKGAGQNGFRLSLRGYAPEQDHDSLTREYFARRINFADPDASALLRKASGQATHEGGKLFSNNDRAYSLLRDWITAGAPGPAKNEATLSSLKLTPQRISGKPGDEHKLKVEATFSDGNSRDVTWLCRFESNDLGISEVDLNGTVRVRRNGETAIRVSFQTAVSVVVVTVPFEKPVDANKFAKKHNFIDELVFKKLTELRIEPSELCTDSEFLRRAFLDTIGVLPTPEEVVRFTADTSIDKRTKLVDHLLARPEFIDHWSLFLGDLLQNRKERDHDVRGTKGVHAFHAWIRKQLAENRGWDMIAKGVLLSSGNSTDSPAVGYYVVTVGEHNDPTRSEVADSVAQAFLGTRIGCARCHNHPLEKYTQDDFYHFAGYFSRIKLERKDPKQGPTLLRLAGTNGKEPHLAKEKVGVRQPRTNAFLAPRPLDRSDLGEVKAGDDPRVKLVEWITDPKNEYFAGAMVNRVWRHYLGVGLVEPVDDLRPSNPPSNPELYQALVKEFVAQKYDLKNLMRHILLSRTYQLSATTMPTNSSDTRFYSHYNTRRLPAEVLLDAIAKATGVPDRFEGYPHGVRAGQLPDPGLKSYFLALFGRSERVTACACERSGEVTMPQLLHLQNGQTVTEKIVNSDGRLAKLIREKKTTEEIVDQLFLATLSRRPTENQKAVVKKSLASGEKEEVLRDIFWVLLNSKEFAFNH